MFFRSTIALAIVVTAASIGSAIAQNSATAPGNADLEARCNQLISVYDRYGASRTGDSDGARNHTRIGAGIDCANGRAAKGVAAMEDLLKRKKFEAPQPPAAIAQSPRQ